MEGSWLETQSHVMLCVPTWPEGHVARAAATASRGFLCKTKMNLPAMERAEEQEVLGSKGNVGKPFDGAVCGSLSLLQPSAT